MDETDNDLNPMQATMKPKIPSNEPERLQALRRYEILDTEAEKEFDDLCQLASQICNTPIAMISLIDENRQWFKARKGVDATETPRDMAFCAHAILETDVMVVEDASKDGRFSENPLVKSEPKIRFYAGAPLRTPDGFQIGTICVVDRQPGHLSSQQVESLRALSRSVVTQLELRRSFLELHRSSQVRDRLERNVRESERQLFRFLEAVPVGVFVLDANGNPYYANQMAQMILGRGIAPDASPEELSDVYKAYVAGTDQEYPTDRLPSVRALSGESTTVDDIEIHRVDKIIPLQSWGAPITDESGKLIFAISAFSDISRHRWAEKRLNAQYAAGRALAESSTLAEGAPKLLQAICESVQWQVGVIWRVDSATNSLRCIDVWHTPKVSIPDFESLTRKLLMSPGLGLPGRVWSTAQPAWIPNVVEDSNFIRTPAALKNGLHAAFGFPILIKNKVVGVIEFFSNEIHEPDSDLLSMMGALGTQIGQFIVRKHAEEKQAQLMRELEEARDELKKLKTNT
jgi:GAF domain-containing protein